MRVALAFVVAFGCARPSAPEPRCVEPHDVLEEGRALRRALLDRDVRATRCSAPEHAPVRIEIHMKLSETDEREVREGGAALHALVGELFGPRWPRGLIASDVARCFGDCCDFTVAAVEPRALYLRRLCFAGREGSRRRLSLATFAEAR